MEEVFLCKLMKKKGSLCSQEFCLIREFLRWQLQHSHLLVLQSVGSSISQFRPCF
ncbi:unnamed protein product [Moneuplotes crassus]|uniref:Uncharacterized protein n=1 Tax=Euplotes crassus TaxID=5936 RepID=A0AAD2D1C3_EUPCR|nr:unnamed protein product [Moneuplotes crassus]